MDEYDPNDVRELLPEYVFKLLYGFREDRAFE